MKLVCEFRNLHDRGDDRLVDEAGIGSIASLQSLRSAMLLPSMFGLSLAASVSHAQVLREPPTAHGPIVWESDYSDDAKVGASSGLKNIPLTPDGTAYVHLGGSLRERFEHFSYPSLGLGPGAAVDDDGYLLHRLLVHADVHLGQHVRGFVQLGSFLEAGREPGPLPTDVSRGDLAQGFVDVAGSLGGVDLGMRGGRQEMVFGTTFVDIREGPNIRQYFDGVRSWATIGQTRIDAFWTKPVVHQPGYFDDRGAQGQDFFGVYSTTRLPMFSDVGLDAYYLRLDRPEAALDAGVARDDRETVGARLFGTLDGFDFNTELAYQFGTFGDRPIGAWAVLSDTGYTFSGLSGRPRLAVKASAASGGHSDGTGTLSTFYPLFPKNNYFNEANLMTFANYVGFNPYVEVQPRSDLAFNVGVNFLWREDTHDGFYQPPGTSILAGNLNDGRELGRMYSAQVEWQAGPNVNVNASVVHFDVKGFLERGDAENATWFGAWSTFSF